MCANRLSLAFIAAGAGHALPACTRDRLPARSALPRSPEERCSSGRFPRTASFGGVQGQRPAPLPQHHTGRRRPCFPACAAIGYPREATLPEVQSNSVLCQVSKGQRPLAGCRGSAPPPTPHNTAGAGPAFPACACDAAAPREALSQEVQRNAVPSGWFPKDSVPLRGPGQRPAPSPQHSRRRPCFPACACDRLPARSALPGVQRKRCSLAGFQGQRPLAGSGSAPPPPTKAMPVLNWLLYRWA